MPSLSDFVTHQLYLLTRARRERDRKALLIQKRRDLLGNSDHTVPFMEWSEWCAKLDAAATLIGSGTQVTGRIESLNNLLLGDEVVLERNCTLWFSNDDGADALITFGDRSFIGTGTYIGSYLPISIGACSLIGAYSYIISANHRFDRRDIPIRDQGFSGAPIVIEADVWLGTHVVILPGVTIGKGAIVAAGSVVNRNIPEYEVWGGSPARQLKIRPQF